MKINPTLTKGVAKVPMVMQLEALECGAAALCMVMAYYGKWVPLEQVRLDYGISRDGSNAKNIYLAAENYGFKVTAYRMEPESLRDQGQFPCIIHWNMNHFVVLCGFRGKHAYMLLPQETATRAQVATILMRISEQQNRP
jgi:ABC-type bacteriocin/lantibiotic exporters, contain an N-terminal double-glycine peptidase domain